MKMTRWIGPRTLARLNHIMELAGHRRYHTEEGAYVLNLVNFYPHDTDLLMAAIDQASNSAIPTTQLLVPDANDLRNAPEVE